MKKITLLITALLGSFAMQAQNPNIGIIGGATTVGWGGPDIDMVTSDGVIYTLDNIVLTTGGLKFRQDDAWNDNNWGGTTWPSGDGIQNQNGVDIPCQAGIYDITFNYTTKHYEFVSQNIYPVISIIGTALAGNSESNDIDLFTADGITYNGTDIPLTGGWLKFRQDHSWTTNWGNSAFPSGIGTQDGQNIVVPGTLVMNVTFNITTGAYEFTVPSVALVGSATPWGWPTNTAGEVDMGVMNSTDGINYMINSVELTAGAAKFREENSWNVQWGGDGGFPSGIGSQNGTDIPVTAGTYSVTLNRTTGAYNFGAPVAAAETFGQDNFMAFPNPTQNSWTFNAVNTEITTIQIVDVTGKTVLTAMPNARFATVDASGLSNGIYLARVESNGAVKTVKLVKN